MLVYRSDYTVVSTWKSRADAMCDARSRAGGDVAECEIERFGDAVVAIYSGPDGQFAAADCAVRVVWGVL